MPRKKPRKKPFDVQIVPDWSEVWTAKEAEEQLTDFHFIGPGWYVTKTDTLLVVPVGRMRSELWWFIDPKGPLRRRKPEQFHFHCWNRSAADPHVGAIFNIIANAPARQDTRR